MSAQEAAVFEFIERIDKHPSMDGLLDDLLQVANVFGFTHMIYTGLPVGNAPIDPLVKSNRFPTE